METCSRPTVLLTGFGPFPGVRHNASGDLVRVLVRRARHARPDHRFVANILPTEWKRAPEQIDVLHAKYVPVLALHFGVAADAEGFRLERYASNICRPACDAVGALPNSGELSPGGKDHCRATIDVDAMAAVLNAKGHRVSLSDDAGGYLCNAVFYRSMARLQCSDCEVAFVHIPQNLANPSFTFDHAVSGALEIVNFALERRSQRLSLTSA